jgi:hypothetical protein
MMANLTDEQAASLDEACQFLKNGQLDDADRSLSSLAQSPGFVPTRLFFAKLCELLDRQGRDEEFLHRINEFKQRFPQAHNPYMLAYLFFLRREDIPSAAQEIGSCPDQYISHTKTRAAVLYAEARLRIYQAHLSIDRNFSRPTDSKGMPLEPVDDLAICMMVRDEADVMMANLLHHYAMGCRKFAVMDNLSRDGTASVVSRFARMHADCTVLLVHDPIEGYYQAKKTQGLCRLARDCFGCAGDELRLIMPLDADEFVDLPSGMGFQWLVDQMMEKECDNVVFHLCNAANGSLVHYDEGQDVYGLVDIVEACSGQIVTKNAFHPRFVSGLTMGNHTLAHDDISRDKIFLACEVGGRIIHYKYRSPRHVASKILNGGQAVNATKLDQYYALHWRTAYADMQQRGFVVAEEMFESYCRTTAKYVGKLGIPPCRI